MSRYEHIEITMPRQDVASSSILKDFITSEEDV